MRQLFVQRGVQPDATAEALEACVLLLEDERLRAEFDVALELFLDTFDTVLPRPEALPFADDAVLFGEIQVLARRRYRDTVDGDFDPHRYKEKVRRLIDDHVTVLDLTQKVRPIRITDPDFAANVNALASPANQILQFEGDLLPSSFEAMEDLVDALRQPPVVDGVFVEVLAVNAGRTDEEGTGLDPETELPFHNRLAERLASSDPHAATRLITTTQALVGEIRRQIAMAGFWENATKQDELRRSVKRDLDRSDLFDYTDLDALAVNLVDLAKANQYRLR